MNFFFAICTIKYQKKQFSRMFISAGSLVLRVPILYGPVERVDESAVTCLLTAVQATDKPTKVSHYERRYPAYTLDIADIICQLIVKAQQVSSCNIIN